MTHDLIIRQLDILLEQDFMSSPKSFLSIMTHDLIIRQLNILLEQDFMSSPQSKSKKLFFFFFFRVLHI